MLIQALGYVASTPCLSHSICGQCFRCWRAGASCLWRHGFALRPFLILRSGRRTVKRRVKRSRLSKKKWVTMSDCMQKGYRYELTDLVGRSFDPEFNPELTPARNARAWCVLRQVHDRLPQGSSRELVQESEAAITWAEGCLRKTDGRSSGGEGRASAFPDDARRRQSDDCPSHAAISPRLHVASGGVSADRIGLSIRVLWYSNAPYQTAKCGIVNTNMEGDK